MPRLVKYPWSPNWYIAYPGAKGGRRTTTGTPDEEAARRALDKFNADLAQPPEEWTIGDLCKAYLHDRDNAVRSPATLRYSLAPIERSFGHLGVVGFARVRVREYIVDRGRDGRSAGTIDKELRTLRQALNWGHREGWRGLENVPYIETPGQGPPRTRWLTRDEAKRLVAACVEPHVRLAILVALHTSGRIGVVLALRWDCIFWEERLVVYPPVHPSSKKRTVTVPINAVLLPALEAAHEGCQTPYVVEWRGKRVHSIKTGFKAAVRRAGLKDVRIHDLRRTAATWMVMAGQSFEKVGAVLGDSPATVRKHYGMFSEDWLRSAVETLE